jgi:hypothetical protein
MRRCFCGILACWLSTAVFGCNSNKQAPQSAANVVRLEGLEGKWRLVRAGGQPPAAVNIKSLWIDIAADGSWVSEIEMEGQFAGMSLKGEGKWSLAEGVITYTSGANSGKSRMRLVSGRLILDPDFTVRKGGTAEVLCEYER